MGSSTEQPTQRSNGLRDARWLLLSHVLPAVVIVAYFVSAYRIVHTRLSAEVLQNWHLIGGILLGLQIPILVTVLARWRSKAVVPWWVAVISLVIHVGLCVFAFLDQTAILPSDIPTYMLPRELFFISIGLVMVPIVHTLLMLIDRTTTTDAQSWKNFMYATVIIALWWFGFSIMDRGWGSFRMREEVTVPLIVMSMILFFFFLVRGVVIMVRNRGERWSENQLWWRILFGFALPLTGLMVHNLVFGDARSTGPIGDFSHPWFYILAMMNGAVVCLPPHDDPRARLAQFFARSVGLTYVLYFALVFLPWLPFSFVLILAFGIGLLMLSPIVLLVVMVSDLIGDVRSLLGHRSPIQVFGTMLLGVLLIPGCLWYSFHSDRATLQAALAYVYAPDLSVNEPPSIAGYAVEDVLRSVRRHKLGHSTEFGSNGVPIISGWYDQQVFDGVTLSDEKTQRLMRVFTGHDLKEEPSGWNGWLDLSLPPNGTVTLTDLKAEPHYEPATHTWRTQVQLTMWNNGSVWEQAEYGTHFHLPPGAFITDNWLMIDGRKKKGILADRAAATWIYQQIITIEHRDPSLLRYIRPEELELRVYPFGQSETRTAGFEVVTKEPLTLTIDHRSVLLGDTVNIFSTKPLLTADGRMAYVPAIAKRSLPTAKAKTVCWFLFDRSLGSDTPTTSFIERAEQLMRQAPFAGAEQHFVSVNAFAQELNAEAWKEGLMKTKCNGGFFLGRAIEHIALSTLQKPGTLPMIAVFTDQWPNAVITSNAMELAALANLPTWFEIAADGTHAHQPCSTASFDTTLTPVDVVRQRRVLWSIAGRSVALLQDDGEASVVPIHGPASEGSTPLQKVPPTADWEAGLEVRALDAQLCMRPYEELESAHQLTRKSFMAHVLARTTAFICLENEAQEAALKKKQDELLKTTSLFDAGDELKPMSEPSEWIALCALLIVLAWRWRSAD